MTPCPHCPRVFRAVFLAAEQRWLTQHVKLDHPDVPDASQSPDARPR